MARWNPLTLPFALAAVFLSSASATLAEPASRDHAQPTAEGLLSELNQRFEASKAAMLERHMNATAEERALLPDVNIEPYRELLAGYAEAARDHAETDDAFPFLSWLVQAGRRLEQRKPINPDDPLLEQQRWALDAILRDHTHDERMSEVVEAMISSYHLSTALYLHTARSIQRDTPFRRIKAECQYAIARAEPDRFSREGLLEQVLEIDPDGWAADRARSDLFEMRSLSIGSTPPDFSGVSPGGEPISLADFRGRVVVIYFTSVNCYPCRQEIPEIKELVARHAEQPFTQLSVFSARDDREAVGAYVEKQGIAWPVLVDQAEPGKNEYLGPIGTLWNISGWPTVFVLDAHGVIRYSYIRGEEVDRAVRALLDELD